MPVNASATQEFWTASNIVSGKSDSGGGIYNNSSGTVTNCTVYSNNAEGYRSSGGGIYNYGTVTNCTVYNNTATDEGGGIHNSEKGTVTNCTVYSNNAEFGGGGIYNSGTVTNCTVYGNSTTGYYSSGGGIYNTGTVTNCTIYNNTALSIGNGLGGGIFNYYGTVTNCTVYNNTATYGGGIYNDSSGTVTNCTVYNNRAESSGGGIRNYYGTVTNCISWKNTLGDICGGGSEKYSCFGEADGKNGNIRGNPLFVNTSGDLSTWDFRLQNGSPCVDAGSVEDAPKTDIMGNPRPGADGKVCMGAYESPDGYEPQSPLPVLGPLYVSESGNDANNGLSWGTALKTIGAALNKVADSDDLYQIWVAEGTYAEGRTLINPSRVALYGGFAGMESQISERNISEHPTIIDGKDACQCVKSSGVLDGFHVERGKTENNGGGINNTGTVTTCTVYNNSVTGFDSYGGGIYNDYGTVTNCTVYGNNALRHGGGIFSDYGTVTNCTVYDNSVTGFDSYGGGIYNWQGTVTNCTVYGNRAEDYGGGIYNNSGTVTNCTVYGNRAEDGGGGICNYYGTVTNCTVYNNSAFGSWGGLGGGSGLGGGIRNYYGTVTNCISWKNSCGDIWGRGSVKYSCFGEADEKDRNIRGNPLFVNTSGNSSTWDFRLQNGSPCVDTGSVSDAPETDIMGNPRPGADSKVCMGAYESPYEYKPQPPRPALDPLYVSKAGSNTNNGLSWGAALKTISAALNKIPDSDDLYQI
ncbi:MAG TPA: right-handed parallel beta-helix repeat-containing protein [Candidatus Sumerlaeota bacterium]|nr:right-handed parallel beta-helix repeat-containing protein [Candidatus Sumerlaeota bacterium]